jgi:hypothetical protein
VLDPRYETLLVACSLLILQKKGATKAPNTH